MIGFSSSTRFVEHDTRPGHPERPDRIRAIYTALHQAKLIPGNPFAQFTKDFRPLPPFANLLHSIEPHPADVKWLRTVHPQSHIDRIKKMCARGGGILDEGDTPVSPASFEVALLALGAILQCCDAVMAGTVQRAFAAVRPPGHHAEPNHPMGFCLFANVAIAAKYLQQKHGLQKIAIVDFDVHHGNGTQACFESDPSVFFVSMHQHPRTCYPGTGFESETGSDAGHGHTLNIPFWPGSTDDAYISAMQNQILPALEHFHPEFLLISAGFDAHADDPLAQMSLTEVGFLRMSQILANFADHHCQGRIVSALEGGYDLRALGRSVVNHLAGLGAT
ncbi:MAG TPA: histone deacetylase [Tepidisphaeraceae bacterium]|nr:histone deacetylase [Tepidisphaeraceae bacterium]